MKNFKTEIDRLVDNIRNWVAQEPLTPLERAVKVYTFDDKTLDHAFGGFAFWAPASVGIQDVTCREFYTEAEKMYYCQLFALDKYRHDVPAVFADMYQIDIEACGTKLQYSEDSMPVIAEHAIKEKKDLLKLKVPDPQKDGRMPYQLELARIHKEKLGDLFYMLVATQAPLSGAVGLRGYRNIIRDMKTDPDFVHDLLEYVTEVQIIYNKAIIDVNGTPPVPCDAWANLPNLRPEQVLEFALPYATRLNEAVKQYANGQGCHWFYGWGYSLAPNWQSFLRTLNGSGTATMFLFEEDIMGRAGYKQVDLKQFKDICRQHKVVVSTSLMPQSIFAGPPERIRQLVTEWHQICGPGGGHEYYTTVPIGTPPEHVQAYVDALKSCKYPVQS
ncbi:MAG: uroporphyrinogen decarboxylase family protein [Eubacteriales bacterium]